MFLGRVPPGLLVFGSAVIKVSTTLVLAKEPSELSEMISILIEGADGLKGLLTRGENISLLFPRDLRASLPQGIFMILFLRSAKNPHAGS